jgi:hypothetical protein
MKLVCSTALLLSLLIVPSAQAIDEGQTQPKLSKQSLALTTTTADLVSLTNGAGNVKGVLCMIYNSGLSMPTVSVKIYVDGGSAQTLTINSSYPFVVDGAGNDSTEMIPMNVRFGSSIKIEITRSSTSREVTCAASWALD